MANISKNAKHFIKSVKKEHFKDVTVLAVLLLAVFGAYLLGEKPTPRRAQETEKTKPEIVWGNRAPKQVIFSFDGGSGAESGEEILAALKKHDVTGTFFLTGKFAEQNPGLVKKIAADGHEIFNHTYSHPNLTTLSEAEIRDELARADAAIKKLTGKSTKPYFRPPYGARDARVLAVAAGAGYQSVYWTTDVLDWKESEGVTAAAAQARIFRNLEPGALFLMHIGGTLTGKILDEVFTEIESRGYAVVSLTKGI